jgi:hypothetical protein
MRLIHLVLIDRHIKEKTGNEAYVFACLHNPDPKNPSFTQ